MVTWLTGSLVTLMRLRGYLGYWLLRLPLLATSLPFLFTWLYKGLRENSDLARLLGYANRLPVTGLASPVIASPWLTSLATAFPRYRLLGESVPIQPTSLCWIIQSVVKWDAKGASAPTHCSVKRMACTSL